jgi:hypothetical protein
MVDWRPAACPKDGVGTRAPFRRPGFHSASCSARTAIFSGSGMPSSSSTSARRGMNSTKSQPSSRVSPAIRAKSR